MLTKHPNLPFEAWRKRFVQDHVEAWDSHHFLLYAMDGSTQRDRFLSQMSKVAYSKLLRNPSWAGDQATDMILLYVRRWWDENQEGIQMAVYLLELSASCAGGTRFKNLAMDAYAAIDVAPSYIVGDDVHRWKIHTFQTDLKSEIIRKALPTSSEIFSIKQSNP